MDKSNSIKNIKKIGFYILLFILGRTFGYFLQNSVGIEVTEYSGNLTYLIYFVFVFSTLIIGVYLNLILHEAGHYIFGKLTGYTFISFHIKKWIFIKENGKLVMKKNRIPGIAGQCLMMPPQPYRENYPYKLYNHGGWISTLVFGMILYAIFLLVPMNEYLRIAVYVLTFISFFHTLFSVIPIEFNGFPNDVQYVGLLNKSEASRKAFWMQLHIHGVNMSGIRLRDMPSEWFRRDETGDPSDPIIATMDAYKCFYDFDRGESKQASLLAQELIDQEGLLEFEKNALLCVLLFNELMAECRPDIINSYYTKSLQKYIQKSLYSPASHRLTYALEKIYFRDEEKAKKAKIKFEKALKTFPNRVEIEMEKNKMVKVEERAKSV